MGTRRLAESGGVQWHRERLRPEWTSLEQDVSFILADALATGSTQCLLSFWGDPFMARHVGLSVLRYIFHVTGYSEPIERLAELDREHRLSG